MQIASHVQVMVRLQQTPFFLKERFNFVEKCLFLEQTMLKSTLMKSQFLFTLAHPSQFSGLFQGPFLKGCSDPRWAILGRSNVGKSSFINKLLKFSLAQTSSQPGKTKAIYFYHWPHAKKIIVDFPGYGYAKASKTQQLCWHECIELYLDQDANLERLFILLDARHGPTPIDQMAIKFLRQKRIPIDFIFTKVDTLKTQAQRCIRQKEVNLEFKALNVEPHSVFWVSHQDSGSFRRLMKQFQIKGD